MMNVQFVYQPNPTIEALWRELVDRAWAAQVDSAPGMTLDDLLGDDVAELIRVNKL